MSFFACKHFLKRWAVHREERKARLRCRSEVRFLPIGHRTIWSWLRHTGLSPLPQKQKQTRDEWKRRDFEGRLCTRRKVPAAEWGLKSCLEAQQMNGETRDQVVPLGWIWWFFSLSRHALSTLTWNNQWWALLARQRAADANWQAENGTSAGGKTISTKGQTTELQANRD